MDPQATRKATKKLRALGIGVTKPRLLILDYLDKNHTHPTVDTIYNDLHVIHPKLSRTTVYNNATTLAQCGAIQLLSIDPSRVNLDGVVEPHAHFLCRECGRIFDLPLEATDPQSAALAASREGHMVETAQVYFKGICRDCQFEDF